MSLALPVVPWENAKRPPRKWQAEALPLVLEALRDGRAGVVSVATGGGKSILQAELVRVCLPKALETGRAIVVSAPREALVEQLAGTISARVGGEHVGMYFGRKKQPRSPIVVCCNNSMPSLTTALAIDERRVSLLIADECHGTESATLRQTIPTMDPLRRVGFTATPFRSSDRQSLGLFDEVLYTYTYDDALRDGVLVGYDPINAVEGEAIGDTNEVCADLIRRFAHGPGIVSAASISDADAYAEYLRERGVPAASIHTGISDGERAQRIEDLRVGRIRCLVHVSLLAEGVDFPWLRWLCLRRPVGARVRFIQELGRVLRVCTPYEDWYEEDLRLWGPKTSATVIDPYDLLGTLGIRHAAAIGRALVEEREKEEARLRGKLTKEQLKAELAALPMPVAVSEATAWAQRLVVSMRTAGMAAEYISGDRDKSGPPSASQLAFLSRLSWMTRYLPEQEREVVKSLVDRAGNLTWGEVSDLISILRAISRASKEQRAIKKHWHMPADVLASVEAPSEIVVEKLRREREATAKAARAAK